MEEKTIQDTTLEKVENEITQIMNSGVRRDNVDYIYKLVDIHKDLKNEEYWKKKEEMLNDERLRC